LEVAERNVSAYGLEERVRLVRSDLFDSLEGERYDLILSNPPYVSDSAIAAFPPEHAAEPAMAHAGGGDGLDLVRRLLAEAAEHLTDDGMMIVEIGTGRTTLEAEFPELPFLWLDTEESEGEVFALQRSGLSGMQPR
jgi:ribosomal protein L3 glutamine methyltransferase